ncbi:DUF2269 family protein [Planosporangium sp. 12N6]|uniref:DUF2269 family protein n=1 Tax=Planosporangium spinosum TaxID=3402278 RepID=UPI003CF4DEF4
MYTFLVTLHVLSAVLLAGPFAVAAFLGNRAIRRHDAADTRDAANFMAVFAAGTLVVTGLGIGALSFSHRYSFRTPWVIISLTLYVITMGIATGYTAPAIRRAAGMIDQGVLERPTAAGAVGGPAAGAPGPGGGRGAGAATGAGTEGGAAADVDVPPPTLTATADDLAAKERLDNLAGRVAGSGALVLVLTAVITVLMVVKPFGP